ncbi:hypothetical protein QTO34_019486, partial [Cnephaeus nilssonii]
MNSSLGLVTVVLLVFGQTRGDSVTQMEGQVTLLEGAPLTVNCTYSATGYPTLFWYSDSAMYYCVLGDTVTGTAGGAEHKLGNLDL